MADSGFAERWVLYDGDLAGELCEQPDGPHDDVIEVVGASEEGLDGPALRGREGLDARQPVDEQAVALVRRNPAGAGVGCTM